MGSLGSLLQMPLSSCSFMALSHDPAHPVEDNHTWGFVAGRWTVGRARGDARRHYIGGRILLGGGGAGGGVATVGVRGVFDLGDHVGIHVPENVGQGQFLILIVFHRLGDGRGGPGVIAVGGKIVHQRVKNVIGHWSIAPNAQAGGGRRRSEHCEELFHF